MKDLFVFKVERSLSSWATLACPSMGETVRYYDFVAESDGFLYRQVRKMVAAAVSVGLGTIRVSDVKRALDNCDPSIIPIVAPAHGLYLTHVSYNDKPEQTSKD